MEEVVEKFSKLKIQHLYSCIDENGHSVCSGNIISLNSVGDVIEDVFGHYACENLAGLVPGPKQKSPDFLYNGIEIELKVFRKSPGFDIGNYYSYIHDLSASGGLYRKLFNTLYIIFEYDIADGYVVIKNYYIKRIWDIVSLTTKYPISCQVKYNKIHNIRPVASKSFNTNNTSKQFVKAIIKLIKIFPYDNSEKYIKLIEDQAQQLFDDWGRCHIPEEIV